MSAPRTRVRSTGWYGSGARRRTVSMQDARRMSNSAWANSSRLITGLLVYTALGWLLSRWLGHQSLLMALGAMVGLGLALYLVVTSLGHEARQDEARQSDGSLSARAGGVEEMRVE